MDTLEPWCNLLIYRGWPFSVLETTVGHFPTNFNTWADQNLFYVSCLNLLYIFNLQYLLFFQKSRACYYQFSSTWFGITGTLAWFQQFLANSCLPNKDLRIMWWYLQMCIRIYGNNKWNFDSRITWILLVIPFDSYSHWCDSESWKAPQTDQQFLILIC